MTPSSLIYLLDWAIKLSRPDQEKFALFFSSNKKAFETGGIITLMNIKNMIYEFEVKNKLNVDFRQLAKA